MAFKILVVCRANVCRSPAAESSIRHALDRAQLHDLVSIESRGTTAPRERGRCAVAAKHLRAAGIDPTAMLSSASRPVRRYDLQMADLILATDLVVGADLLRLDPAIREKLFTLRECAVLAGYASGRFRAQTKAGSTADDESSTLRRLVAEMDASRGLVPIPSGRKAPVLRRRKKVSLFDVDDVHNLSRRRHRLMVDDVTALTDTIVTALAAMIESNRPGRHRGD